MALRALLLGSLVLATASVGCSDAEQSQDEPVFVDLGKESGFGFNTRTYAAEAGDFDGDGAPDVVVTFHSVGPVENGRLDTIYRNVDGTFQEHQVLPVRDRHDCTFGDPNGDDRLDLYCTIGGDRGEGFNPNELWMQQPDGIFVDMAEAWGVTDVLGRGRQATFLDVNDDGWEDLFVGNLPGRVDGLPSANRLFVNDGGTNFRPAPEYGIDGELGAEYCAEEGEVVSDSGVDLLVCTGNPEFGLRLYANQGGGSLRDATDRWGLEPLGARKVIAEDLNGDGDAELVVVTPTEAAIWERNGTEFTKVMSVPAPGGWDAALGDVDGDGDLDLYILQTGFSTCSDFFAPEEWDDRADFILTRDGEDLSEWSQHEVPSTGRGCGDVVVSLDHDEDGRDGFLVLNGDRLANGPVQLIVAE
jgi:FG-GAP-like repeat